MLQPLHYSVLSPQSSVLVLRHYRRVQAALVAARLVGDFELAAGGGDVLAALDADGAGNVGVGEDLGEGAHLFAPRRPQARAGDRVERDEVDVAQLALEQGGQFT